MFGAKSADLLHNRGSLAKTGRGMPHLFVAGKYYITGEQIHRQSRWCAVGDKGVKLLWSMKIFHLITPVRLTAVRQSCLIDRLTRLWLLICWLQWEMNFPS